METRFSIYQLTNLTKPPVFSKSFIERFPHIFSQALARLLFADFIPVRHLVLRLGVVGQEEVADHDAVDRVEVIEFVAAGLLSANQSCGLPLTVRN